MTIELRRIIASGAIAAGLIAAMMLGAQGPLPAAAAPKAEKFVDNWPEPSRRTALAMIEKHGQPDRRDANSVTWFGLYLGRRTVVHRSDRIGDAVEQVVLYNVPQEKGGPVTVFDPRIKLDRSTGEMSVRTESASTNLLVLNLAHEVASGYRTVVQAQQFRDRQMRLAATGKSSRYREELIFEQPLPARSGLFILPGNATPPP